MKMSMNNAIFFMKKLFNRKKKSLMYFMPLGNKELLGSITLNKKMLSEDSYLE
jgi:hypothetical protein